MSLLPNVLSGVGRGDRAGVGKSYNMRAFVNLLPSNSLIRRLFRGWHATCIAEAQSVWPAGQEIAMRMSPICKCVAAAGFALSLTGGAASAAVISYSTSFGPADVATFVPPPDGTSIVVYLPAFDTTQFDVTKLLGITIQLSDSGTASINVTNSSGSTRTSTSQSATIGMNVTGPGSLYTSNILSAVNSNSLSVPGNSTAHVTGLPVSASSTVSVSPADWALYESAGVLALTFNILNDGGSFTGSGGVGSLSYGGDAVVSGTVTINYEMVPEPMSLTIIGTGLLGMAYARRRKQGL